MSGIIRSYNRNMKRNKLRKEKMKQLEEAARKRINEKKLVEM